MRTLLKPILVGGFIAGTLDLIAAFLLFGRRMPLGIAAGLLGRSAFQGGAGTWILGVFLHYFIAYAAAAIYCLASLRLDFLKRHFLVCGMFYGIAVFLVMNLVILPMSGLHSAGPFQLSSLRLGLIVHMFAVGVPIAYCLRRFST
jgi:hypothetical protein